MGYLHKIYADAANKAGDALAIDGGLGAVSYVDLLDRANRVCRELVKHGVMPGSRIAISDSTRDIHFFATILAISALNCSVVPFAGSLSAEERLRLRALEASAVVADMESGLPELHDAVQARESRAVDSECYVISTSGSTSRPKDIAITDANIASYGQYLASCGRVGAGDRISQNFKPQFDAFWEVMLMAALGRGTMILPAGRENLLVDGFCGRWGINIWNSVPSHVTIAKRTGHLPGHSLNGVDLAIFGGEALTPHVLSAWREAAPRCAVINSYGPSEATIVVAEHKIAVDAPEPYGNVPIGRVLPHMEYCLIEPEDAPGEQELCIRGPQLFAGYLDARHNAGRFYTGRAGTQKVSAKQQPGPGDWFRTGDIVTESADGLRFVRRIDQQVKVRGQRVDLSAVQAEICCCPGVSDALVVVLDEAVYAVVEATRRAAGLDGEVDFSRLREYARPRRIVWVESMPRLANGKYDLRAIERLVRESFSTAPVRSVKS